MTDIVLQCPAMTRDGVLNVRIPEDVKDAVRRAGEDDHGRSMSGMVVRILSEWCIEKGYLAPPSAPTAPAKRGKGR